MSFALFGCFAQAALLAGIAKTAQTKHATIAKHLVKLGLHGLCLNARPQAYFSKQPFS